MSDGPPRKRRRQAPWHVRFDMLPREIWDRIVGFLDDAELRKMACCVPGLFLNWVGRHPNAIVRELDGKRYRSDRVHRVLAACMMRDAQHAARLTGEGILQLHCAKARPVWQDAPDDVYRLLCAIQAPIAILRGQYVLPPRGIPAERLREFVDFHAGRYRFDRRPDMPFADWVEVAPAELRGRYTEEDLSTLDAAHCFRLVDRGKLAGMTQAHRQLVVQRAFSASHTGFATHPSEDPTFAPDEPKRVYVMIPWGTSILREVRSVHFELEGDVPWGVLYHHAPRMRFRVSNIASLQRHIRDDATVLGLEVTMRICEFLSAWDAVIPRVDRNVLRKLPLVFLKYDFYTADEAARIVVNTVNTFEADVFLPPPRDRRRLACGIESVQVRSILSNLDDAMLERIRALSPRAYHILCAALCPAPWDIVTSQ